MKIKRIQRALDSLFKVNSLIIAVTALLFVGLIGTLDRASGTTGVVLNPERESQIYMAITFLAIIASICFFTNWKCEKIRMWLEETERRIELERNRKE